MENGPFIDDFPIKTSIYEGFSMAMLNNPMVFCFFLGIWGFFLFDEAIFFSWRDIKVEFRWTNTCLTLFFANLDFCFFLSNFRMSVRCIWGIFYCWGFLLKSIWASEELQWIYCWGSSEILLDGHGCLQMGPDGSARLRIYLDSFEWLRKALSRLEIPKKKSSIYSFQRGGSHFFFPAPFPLQAMYYI